MANANTPSYLQKVQWLMTWYRKQEQSAGGETRRNFNDLPGGRCHQDSHRCLRYWTAHHRDARMEFEDLLGNLDYCEAREQEYEANGHDLARMRWAGSWVSDKAQESGDRARHDALIRELAHEREQYQVSQLRQHVLDSLRLTANAATYKETLCDLAHFYGVCEEAVSAPVFEEWQKLASGPGHRHWHRVLPLCVEHHRDATEEYDRLCHDAEFEATREREYLASERDVTKMAWHGRWHRCPDRAPRERAADLETLDELRAQQQQQ